MNGIWCMENEKNELGLSVPPLNFFYIDQKKP